jgi:hypothetical protein
MKWWPAPVADCFRVLSDVLNKHRFPSSCMHAAEQQLMCKAHQPCLKPLAISGLEKAVLAVYHAGFLLLGVLHTTNTPLTVLGVAIRNSPGDASRWHGMWPPRLAPLWHSVWHNCLRCIRGQRTSVPGSLLASDVVHKSCIHDAA